MSIIHFYTVIMSNPIGYNDFGLIDSVSPQLIFNQNWLCRQPFSCLNALRRWFYLCFTWENCSCCLPFTKCSKFGLVLRINLTNCKTWWFWSHRYWFLSLWFQRLWFLQLRFLSLLLFRFPFLWLWPLFLFPFGPFRSWFLCRRFLVTWIFGTTNGIANNSQAMTTASISTETFHWCGGQVKPEDEKWIC